MTEKSIQKKLTDMFQKFFYEKVKSIKRIKGGVSDRIIYKIKSNKYVCIGVHNSKLKENIAFIEFSKSLKLAGFNVPEIYYISDCKEFYLEEFAGDKSLYDLIKKGKLNENEKIKFYKKALKDLLQIQFKGLEVINFKYCYETKVFDKKQMKFDISKFKNFYLRKLIKIKFSEKKLNDIFKIIIEELLKEKNLYFMYRDFQPRNIMVKDADLYYIDYQSGRKGALQYDVASFLYSGSIEISEKERSVLLNYYLKNLRGRINSAKFKSTFYYFVLIRLLQVLGSYGFTYSKSKDKSLLKKTDKALTNLSSIGNKLKDKKIKEFISYLTLGK